MLAPKHRKVPKTGSIASSEGISANLSALTVLAVALVVAGCATPAVSRYPQNDCVAYAYAKREFKADVKWCIHYAEVRGDALEVHVSWEIVKLAGKVATIFQLTDEGNPTMYLTDASGYRYDPTRVSGAALGGAHRAGSLQSGSFFFPPPRAGARSFLFHDDENGVALRVRW
jgi:hypothetical protein